MSHPNSHTVGTKGTTLHDHESTLRKLFQHQINKVVILHQNMCQCKQMAEDAKFRHALENMQYKDCTPTDITFLCTQISSSIPGRPCILDDDFCSVLIITTLNIHKYMICTMGSQRFSIETSQKLTDFFSDDSLHCKSEVKK